MASEPTCFMNLNSTVTLHIKAQLLFLVFKAPVLCQFFLKGGELVVVKKVAAVLVVRHDLHPDQLEIHFVESYLGAVAHFATEILCTALYLFVCLSAKNKHLSVALFSIFHNGF